ncbi:MAG: segregation and condensation protein A, partial [Gammaproteobacteria bacterium]
MADQEVSKEEQILRIMRGVLTNVAKDTYTKPGFRHPLSDATIQGIRDCLALISAREHELAAGAGRPSTARPRYVDEPQATQSIPVNVIG